MKPRWMLSIVGTAMVLSAVTPQACLSADPATARSTAVAAAQGVDLNFGSPTLHATITKGRPRSVLVIHAGLEANLGGADLHMAVLINGLDPSSKPSFGGLTSAECLPTSTCALTAVWWADLDALEAQLPGGVIGKPVNVDLFGEDSNFGSTGNASLVVEMLKK